MHRRLWWHLRILDLRAAGDYNLDVSSAFLLSNTKMPSNLDDIDLGPSATAAWAEREGFTEMSYTLLRCESAVAFDRLSSSNIPAGKVEEVVGKFSNSIHSKYLRFFDAKPNLLICRLGSDTGRLLISKVRLRSHFRALRLSASLSEKTKPSPELVQELLESATTLLEFHARTGSVYSHWAWALRTLMQWHAVSFVLSQLDAVIDKIVTQRKDCSGVDDKTVLEILPELFHRAWHAVDVAFRQCEPEAVWDPVKGLKLRVETRLNGRADKSENVGVEVKYPGGELGGSDVRLMGFEVEEMMGTGSLR
jgi:hypothetical protein